MEDLQFQDLYWNSGVSRVQAGKAILRSLSNLTWLEEVRKQKDTNTMPCTLYSTSVKVCPQPAKQVADLQDILCQSGRRAKRSQHPISWSNLGIFKQVKGRLYRFIIKGSPFTHILPKEHGKELCVQSFKIALNIIFIHKMLQLLMTKVSSY